MKKIIRKQNYIFISALMFAILTSGCKKEYPATAYVNHTGEKGTVTDIDGNIYKTIGIGSQIWMAENLRVTHYRNGVLIPNVQDKTLWNASITGAYCSYDNDTTFSSQYGFLYNWYAVNDAKYLAPEGWHIPESEEWDTLINALGGEAIAGTKLKEAGATHWELPLGTNTSGFSALPGGWRINMGDYFYMKGSGYWWTKSHDYLPGSFAYSFALYNDSASINRLAILNAFGLSVRCVKNSE